MNLLLPLVLLVAASPASAPAQESCPFLPQYRVLERKIASKPPVAALKSLNAYAQDPGNENPAACESIELDRQIGLRERMLSTLVSTGAPCLHADAAFHCDAPDQNTTQCDGIVADGTAQPDAVRMRPSPAARPAMFVQLRTRIPGARLIGVYRTSLGDIAAGRAVVRVDATHPISVRSRSQGVVVIALLSAPGPYKVRKLVWYF